MWFFVIELRNIYYDYFLNSIEELGISYYSRKDLSYILYILINFCWDRNIVVVL